MALNDVHIEHTHSSAVELPCALLYACSQSHTYTQPPQGQCAPPTAHLRALAPPWPLVQQQHTPAAACPAPLLLQTAARLCAHAPHWLPASGHTGTIFVDHPCSAPFCNPRCTSTSLASRKYLCACVRSPQALEDVQGKGPADCLTPSKCMQGSPVTAALFVHRHLFFRGPVTAALFVHRHLFFRGPVTAIGGFLFIVWRHASKRGSVPLHMLEQMPLPIVRAIQLSSAQEKGFYC
eukprot:708619-Pelagomonas_calceolata.AAC.2